MPQLSDRLRGAHDGDEGVVAVIVTFFFGAGVFLVLLALVIDIGSMQLERRQLQNGAEAASVQAAFDCSLDGSGTHVCGNLAPPIQIASRNASDQTETITATDLCGAGNAKLSACTTLRTARNCPTAPTAAKWVQATTSTWSAGGSPYVPQFFANAVGQKPQTVYACSQAIWGVPAAATSLMTPFTIAGTCWYSQTASALGFGPTAWSTPAAAKYETVTAATYTSGSTQTPSGSTCGTSTPGGFGSLNTVSNTSCTVSAFMPSPYANWLGQQTGNSIPCPDISSLLGHIVTVPIFDCGYQVAGGAAIATGLQYQSPGTFTTPCTNQTVTLSNGTYFRIIGLASYFFAGYDFGGNQQAFYSTLSDPNPISKSNEPAVCKANQNCIFGWYTQQSLLSTAPIDPNAPNLGLNVVSLVG